MNHRFLMTFRKLAKFNRFRLLMLLRHVLFLVVCWVRHSLVRSYHFFSLRDHRFFIRVPVLSRLTTVSSREPFLIYAGSTSTSRFPSTGWLIEFRVTLSSPNSVTRVTPSTTNSCDCSKWNQLLVAAPSVMACFIIWANVRYCPKHSIVVCESV